MLSGAGTAKSDTPLLLLIKRENAILGGQGDRGDHR